MKKSNFISPSNVDFWFDNDRYFNFLQEDKNLFNFDMIKLSFIRKAISNFVRILTRRNIPVYFNDADANVNFGGKVIYISAKINTKQDFDCAVGQALHEGAHTLKTDFDAVLVAWANVPHEIFKVSDSKNISRASIEKFIKNMWNVIEDRYIDNYVFNSAPGYRGYYVSLYNQFWNCPEVDEYLISDYFRYPSLKSYDYRITNFTNENTDLLALPCLEDIAKVIDISHIDRLETTKDRVNAAFEVVKIVLDCIDKEEKIKLGGSLSKGNKQNGLANPNDFFDFGDEKEEEIDVSKKVIDEISDIVNDRDPDPENIKENENVVKKINDGQPISKNISREIDKMLESQRKFLNGELPKEAVTPSQKSLLDLIEKHGIILVRVDLPTILSGNDKTLRVDCIVVQKMTKNLILSGADVFPLCGVMKVGESDPLPPSNVLDAVKKGIQLGTKLGRKLQIRSEVNPIKIVRKKRGKINKRQIHEAAFDADDLFYKIHIDEHHKANLHITVDASGSMSQGCKWDRTMTAVVAICKATSMIDNIHVTVSFRSTQVSGDVQLPYVILAYDSVIDKFSKVKNLFPYLIPNGCTPEGLAFGAIMNLFERITPDEEDRYFLNLSDGEPYYHLNVPETGLTIIYADEAGTTHTKSQVDKIRRQGTEILSYFIEDSYLKQDCPEDNVLYKNFKKMYGRSAKFIRIENIVDLARTMNELFLKRE